MAGGVTGAEDFTANASVTGARLNAHVNNATLANIAQSDIAANSGLVVRSASAPTDTDALWFDTSNLIARIHNGTGWIPVGIGAVLTNKSGGTVNAGDVVVADTTNDNSFKTTTTDGDQTVLGIVAETVAADATGVIIYSGLMDVQVTGSVTRGQFLKSSTTAKKATAGSTKSIASFAIALEAGTDTTVSALVIGVGGGLNSAGDETITGDWTFSGDNTYSGISTFSGTIAGATPFVFEGATANDYETTLAITDPTADRTLTIPDEDIDLGNGTIKGWIKFDGTGTVAITSSYNVTSITDNSAGNYTVTWDTDFADDDYCYVCAGGNDDNSGETSTYATPQDQGTGYCRIVVNADTGTDTDVQAVYVMAVGAQT